MIFKVLVFSRSQVETGIQLFNKHNIGIISIHHPGKHLLDESFLTIKNIKHVPTISICVSDCSLKEYERCGDDVKNNLILFNDKLAKQIINFVNTYKDKIDTLIVHCDAGESRSGAVGVWANRYLELDEKEFLENNKKIYPNSYIYNILYSVSGMKKSYYSFWEQHLTRDDIRKLI